MSVRWTDEAETPRRPYAAYLARMEAAPRRAEWWRGVKQWLKALVGL